jgi:hypothetical protein
VSPNPALADKLISMIKTKFKDGAVTLSLKDPGANLRMETNNVAFLNTWVRSGNQLVTLDCTNMRPTANLTRSHVLAAGFRKYGDGEDDIRVCLTLAYTGIMAMAYTNIDKPSPPPLILDLVPAHTQTEFNEKSGSARIDASNMDVAELMMVHVLESCSYAFIEGWDNIKLIKKVISKLRLVSMFLSDTTISGVIDDYPSPRARYDLEDSLPVILVFNRETKKTTIIFTCMQISSAIGGPTRSNRMSGKMYIPIIHELVCAFLDVSGAENRMTAIPSFTTGDVSIFRQALSKDGAAKITKDLRRHGMLPESVEFLSPGQAGYENGIGMMSAEERMAASEKGYENGLGAMSAEERKAAGEKGYENGIGMMSAEERMAAGEKGYENGIGMMSAEERMAASEKGYENGLGAMSAEERSKVSAVRAQSDFDKWLVNLSKVKTFIADEGRTPRQKSSDAGERILANWIRNSKMNKEREQLMRRDIPSIFIDAKRGRPQKRK